MATQLTVEFIEHVHDILVGAFLPFDETVNPAEYRNHALIASAIARPYQTVFGAEAYPTIHEKAAALFHSLACNHCFINGNKRTAVITLDIFLAINRHLFTMPPDSIYLLAKDTVKANSIGKSLDDIKRDLAADIERHSVPVDAFDMPEVREYLGDRYEAIHAHVKRFMGYIEGITKSIESGNFSEPA